MEEESKNFKLETAYNRLNLYQQHDCFELRSEDNALQSRIDLSQPQRLGLKNLEHLMAVLLFMPEPKSVLLLGTAAGSLVHFLRHYLPRAQLTAVDIDVELVEKMLQMKILPAAGNGLSYVYADAADFLSHCDTAYDLILVDIFSGSQSPAWLLEKKEIEQLHRLLEVDGALAYNLLIDSEHQFKNFYRDLRIAFANRTLCLPVQDFENTIAFAIRHPMAQRDMHWYMQHAMELSNRYEIDFLPILSVIYNTNPVGAGVL